MIFLYDRIQSRRYSTTFMTVFVVIFFIVPIKAVLSQERHQIDPDKKYYGFIDKTGKFVIAPRFKYVDSFSEGLAYVKLGDRYGFINHRGDFVIESKYKDCLH